MLRALSLSSFFLLASIPAFSALPSFDKLSIDPARTYRVRDLRLSRGDIRIYLNEGVLAFLAPVDGRVLGAVFTTQGTDVGDGEIVIMPPTRSERASLAHFIKTPNLDDHFNIAVFLFADDTLQDVLSHSAGRTAPEVAAAIFDQANQAARSLAAQFRLTLTTSLLDNHAPADGFFFAAIASRNFGTFNVLYKPASFEPVSVDSVSSSSRFQVWTSFRPRRAPPYVPPAPEISEIHLDANIHSDLSMSVADSFMFNVLPNAGRVLAFELSDALRVNTATVDSKPVEIVQGQPGGGFVLVSETPIAAGPHHVEVNYAGSVIRRTGKSAYFVDERNVWYPYTTTMYTTFDLTFHCPENLHLVSTGEPVSEEVSNGDRIVHRRTLAPVHLAGFDLGDFKLATAEHGPYRVECSSSDIAGQTEKILAAYTKQWVPLNLHTLAVAPIPGYFGQGLPGMVYLSSLSFVPEEDRPPELRGARFDTFFDQMLLPHEVAHQWWGNLVASADYRANWLMEASANLAALQPGVLDRYRADLTPEVESAGPLDFGTRLIDNVNFRSWALITYEKGTWVLQMLRSRLGDELFNKMQLRILHDYASRPITNDEFRRVAADFLPAGQPDRDLSLFFETWIYGTGIPHLRLHRSGTQFTLVISGVEDDFTVDVPLRCNGQIRWIRASSGENTISGINQSCALPAKTEFLYFE